MVNLSEKDLATIRQIFEKNMKDLGYEDISEINGDNTEDFCKIILLKLDKFYANL